MSQDAPRGRWTRAATLGDAQMLAVALLLVALTTGTLLPRLGREGRAFPIPPPIQPGGPEELRPPSEVPAAIGSRSNPSPALALDLNRADAQALQALPGVGPVLAERIVAYRRTHGLFRTREDLLQVPGIGSQRWERIRGLVRVGEGA
ncbi:MAG TPA: helix-hairpin-helix domain-containing protein [Candidatus Methylomirabilis sp.]|nr:helix-hairpin-helix domain-containing protein [Candidatus Methylomirabilis sp.]